METEHARRCRGRMESNTLTKIAETDAVMSSAPVTLDDYARWQAERQRLLLGIERM